MLVKVEAQTIAKTLQDVEVDALVDPHPEKLSVVVAQTIADALSVCGWWNKSKKNLTLLQV